MSVAAHNQSAIRKKIGSIPFGNIRKKRNGAFISARRLCSGLIVMELATAKSPCFYRQGRQIADEPHHFGGVFICCPSVEVYALLSDDGQQLCHSDNQKPQ